MSTDSLTVISALAPDANVVFQFFAFFSRFEYSLKRSGFLKPGERAEANWDTYANTLRGRFAIIDNPTFRDATDFLRREPPKTQVITCGELAWRETIQGAGEHHEQYILRLVRTVRNNLFHGGKYPVPLGQIIDVARNRLLLKAGVTILNECLVLSECVRSKFEDTA